MSSSPPSLPPKESSNSNMPALRNKGKGKGKSSADAMTPSSMNSGRNSAAGPRIPQIGSQRSAAAALPNRSSSSTRQIIASTSHRAGGSRRGAGGTSAGGVNLLYRGPSSANVIGAASSNVNTPTNAGGGPPGGGFSTPMSGTTTMNKRSYNNGGSPAAQSSAGRNDPNNSPGGGNYTTSTTPPSIRATSKEIAAQLDELDIGRQAFEDAKYRYTQAQKEKLLKYEKSRNKNNPKAKFLAKLDYYCGLLICVNMLILGIEIDYGESFEAGPPKNPFWWVETCILLVFCWELYYRLRFEIQIKVVTIYVDPESTGDELVNAQLREILNAKNARLAGARERALLDRDGIEDELNENATKSMRRVNRTGRSSLNIDILDGGDGVEGRHSATEDQDLEEVGQNGKTNDFPPPTSPTNSDGAQTVGTTSNATETSSTVIVPQELEIIEMEMQLTAKNCFRYGMVWMTLYSGTERFVQVSWYSLDALVILVSAIDVWVFALFFADDNNAKSVSALRILRLLRVLRSIKLIRYVKDLYILVHGLGRALRSIVWVMVLLCMIIYVCAILLTSQVKGNQFYEGTEQEQATNTVDPDRKKVHEYFESVSASMLTLFQVVTLENWPDIARTMMEETGAYGFFFAIFIVITNFMMMSLFVGVLVDTLQSAANTADLTLVQQIKQQQTAMAQELKIVFALVDTDGDGSVSRTEFKRAMGAEVGDPGQENRNGSGKNPADLAGGEQQEQDGMQIQRFSTTQMLLREKITTLNVQESEIDWLFETLDTDQSGELSMEEFVSGILKARESEISFHFASQTNFLLREFRKLEGIVSKLSKKLEESGQLREQLPGTSSTLDDKKKI